MQTTLLSSNRLSKPMFYIGVEQSAQPRNRLVKHSASINFKQIFGHVVLVSLHWGWQQDRALPQLSPRNKAGLALCSERHQRELGCWSQETTSATLLAARLISTKAATKAQSTRDSIIIAASNEHRNWAMRGALKSISTWEEEAFPWLLYSGWGLQ